MKIYRPSYRTADKLLVCDLEHGLVHKHIMQLLLTVTSYCIYPGVNCMTMTSFP